MTTLLMAFGNVIDIKMAKNRYDFVRVIIFFRIFASDMKTKQRKDYENKTYTYMHTVDNGSDFSLRPIG